MSKNGLNFRPLEPKDIEVRVQSVAKNGKSCLVLLYKDARVDMKMLDETVGALNWESSFEVINGNLFASVSIWDEDKKQWVTKTDVGTESNTEKEKGQASDAFKRACFKWGIGRELYTKLDTRIFYTDEELAGDGSKAKFLKFYVDSITIDEENREITGLVIKDQNGNVRYDKNNLSKPNKRSNSATKSKPTQNTKAPVEQPKTTNVDTRSQKRSELILLIKESGLDVKQYSAEKGLSNTTTEARFDELIAELKEVV